MYIPTNTPFGKMTYEMNTLLQEAKGKVTRLKNACAAAGGGAGIEASELFLVPPGQGGAFYQLMIDLDGALNPATGALSDASLATIDAGD